MPIFDYVSIQIPVLKYHGERIVESSIINEFLEEAYPSSGNTLMPEEAIDKANARLAIDLCSFRFVPLYYRILIHEGDEQAKFSRMMLDTLREIDHLLRQASPSGPYWFGDQFTLVDIAFVPFLDRFVPLLFLQSPHLNRNGQSEDP